MDSQDGIVLDELFKLQAELDADIAKRHNVTYEDTFDRRVLALLVELGEFANETRCFKYWSLKPASAKEVILDEYADGMHFFLSLGVALGVESYSHRFNPYEKDLSKQLVAVYKNVAAMHQDFDGEHYVAAFSSYLNILPMFGWGADEAIAAYKKKLGVNHQRQENKY